ncbi:right-handed parallel beta-helix repeat-containing protein [Asaia platycodi]|uniref:right-handed parallel beta-helix repeat-containing protein n=1 Tax=Asaia platycodi TaxID=610243 RepID=UPI000B335967|nr:right-handed parallel beta-helix repeat-containing protein [Asaia platycodi]
MRSDPYFRSAIYRILRQLVAVTALSIAMLSMPEIVVLAAPHNTMSAACRVLDQMRVGDRDASSALAACITSQPPGGVIALAPGRYLITAPLLITQPVSISTRGMARSAPTCQVHDPRCATLLLQLRPDTIKPRLMPVTIRSHGVSFDHIVFSGGANAPLCLDPARRPAGGGMSVSGDDFSLTGSVLASFACYTALEYENGANGHIAGNTIVGNGTHNVHLMWSDGLTIHDAQHLSVVSNRFVDNTDVQLIFGGCTDCIVANNIFRHSGLSAGGSYAELMVQAWPKATSGRYDGTKVVGNDIDCGHSEAAVSD